MRDVLVNVHGRGDTVLRDVFVVVWTRFTVDRVDTRNWNSLVSPGYVSVGGVREKVRDHSRIYQAKGIGKRAKNPKEVKVARMSLA